MSHRDEQRLRVASIPAHHAYVDAVLPGPTQVTAWQPQPPTDLQPGQWFPHPLLDAQQLAEHADRLDLVHLHFGFEHRSVEQIQAFVAQCKASGVALVVTVHDLENPHLTDQTEHLKRLDVLLEAAHQVITLTDSAARAIHYRHGRVATVAPHPYVVLPVQAGKIREQVAPHRNGQRVAVFLKDIRTNTVTDPEFYMELERHLRRGQLTIFAHHSAAQHPLVTALYHGLGEHLHLHERFSDHQLFTAVAGFDVVILPYTHGSHSGWLEMCRDLGVTVVAPSTGHFADQADRPGAVVPYTTGDGAQAAHAVERALERGPLPMVVDREAQQAEAVRTHLEIYTRAVAQIQGAGPTEVTP